MTGLVAFDLDGTLVDSATDLAAAASALTVELGGRALTRAEVVAMVGEGAPMLVHRALGAAGLDPETPGAIARFLTLYDERMLDTTVLYAGVRDVLDALDPLLPLAVVTNKPDRPARRVLEALGVRQYFVEVIGGDGAWPRKPDPAGLRSLSVHAHGGPLVLVGDSPVDAETAARAGAAFVLASYGFGAAGFDVVAAAPFVAAAPGDLPRVIGAALRLGRQTS
ncbi:MAG: HAD hydrolase-like protein [Acidobacteria bacterium]|nr:HAD hydrolase-like protein [Acidobacteriota bacterium]